MQDQIAAFSRSLQTLATEYSNPAVIMNHIPVLKEHMDKVQLVIDHKEYVLAGLVALFVLRRTAKKRKKTRANHVSMVMPAPYRGTESPLDAGPPIDAESEDEAQPLRLRKPRQVTPPPTAASEDALDRLAAQVSARRPASESCSAAGDPAVDLSQVALVTRPALTPDEARCRVIVQAAIARMNAPYLVMARTSLSALIEPGQAVVGPARASALAALEGLTLDFGLFDRAGRLVVALDILRPRAALGTQAQHQALIAQVLTQVQVPLVSMTFGETPDEVMLKLQTALTGTATPQTAPETPAATTRPGRPVRPARPKRPAAAIAAE